MNSFAVIGKTMLRHIIHLEYFSFSLCCPFIWIREWNRTGNWRFPLSAMSQSSSFLIMVFIWLSHLDFFFKRNQNMEKLILVCVAHTPIWRTDKDKLWEFESSCEIHGSAVMWCSKLWLRQEKIHHSWCQEASHPHFIVVTGFGVPLCHCTMVIARLRTSHVN